MDAWMGSCQMKKIAYFLIGASGSGKSTTVEQLKNDHAGQNVNVFSLDACRLAFYSLFGTEDCGIICGKLLMREMKFNFPTDRVEMAKFYAEAFAFANERGSQFDQFVTDNWLDVRHNSDVVIVDNTNITRKQRTRWVSELRNMRTAEFHIVMVEFLVPLDTLIWRQSTRQDKSIPLSAVRQQFFRQEAALLGSECDEVRVVSSIDRDVKGDSDELNFALKAHNKFVSEHASK